MFNSDFFKDSMYQKVKSPAEVVVGTLRLTGDLQGPDPRLMETGQEPAYMGQSLHDPPSVEGWHTGREWINSGSVVKRINFMVDRLSDTDLPGVQDIVTRVANGEQAMTPGGAGGQMPRIHRSAGSIRADQKRAAVPRRRRGPRILVMRRRPRYLRPPRGRYALPNRRYYGVPVRVVVQIPSPLTGEG